VGGPSRRRLARAGSRSNSVIGLDTSVVVRYLVGTPSAQARRAARLIDDDATECGVSIVALAECAHVLRTQYEVSQRDIIDALIGFIQRANVRVVDIRSDLLVETLVRARDLPGRPIPDAMIVAASMAADAIPLATFDRGQHRYGIVTRDP
jgi:predicted nucleic acid-binding protein